MLFIIFLLQSWEDYKRTWVALLSSHTHRVPHRDDLVSVTDYLCVRDRDKMGLPLSQSSKFSVRLHQCSKNIFTLNT